MTISNKHLRPGEAVVIDRHPHWWYLTPRALLLVATMVAGILVLVYEDNFNSAATAVKILAAALVVAALGAFIIRLIGWRTTEFIITSERCIFRSGVLKKQGIEIPIDRISAVFFSQTFFERILRAGDLGIESSGEGSRQNFSDILDPVGVQNTIYQQMENNENRKYDRIGSEAREARGDAQAPQPLVQQSTQVLTVAEQIEKLADLRDRGVITAEEFAAQKDQLLS